MKKISLLIFVLAILYFSFGKYLSSNKELGKNVSEKHNLPYPAVIAHRGASFYAPESTEPSYIIAREIGADFLEMDVQMSKDGVPVVFHDDFVTEKTNAVKIFPDRANSIIGDFTLAELKQLDAGSWFNEKFPDRARTSFKGLKILTFEEVINIAENNKPYLGLYIETKTPEQYPGIEEKMITIMKNHSWLTDNAMPKGTVVMQSFSINSLKIFKSSVPQIPRILLYSNKLSDWNTRLSEAQNIGAGIGPDAFQGWPWQTKKAHDMGLAVHLYTVNQKWQFAIVNRFGADGLFTDRCDLLMEFYGKKPNKTINQIMSDYKY